MSSTIAAIDVGSNAIRLSIARIGAAGHFEIIQNAREPVRLGHDVFSIGRIAPETMKAAAQAFRRFREQLNKHSVTRFKAVATSAVREAENGAEFSALVAKRYGIDVAVIGPEEEARLVHLAIKDRVRMNGRIALLVDIGGGSVEISLATGSGIISTESYAMGSVRLLQILDQRRMNASRFNQLVSRYVDVTRDRLRKELGRQKLQLCIGTGGSIESMGEIRRTLFKKKSDSKISSVELQSLVRRLQKMSVEERVREFHLRPDRADVISPAAVVLQKIVQQAGVHEVLIPRVGVKDGVLAEIIWEVIYRGKHLDRNQVIASALQLGRKYSFDEQHGTAVARIALQIFDQTRSVHDLDAESRLILEVAALLHDIGQFVGVSNHHKHTFYLLHTGPIVGLSPSQMLLVANVARYHRKSLPRMDHEPFRVLSPRERALVATLVAILRVADSIDRQHDNRAQSVELTLRKPGVILRLKGKGDMLLEKWALARRSAPFEKIFGTLVVEEEPEFQSSRGSPRA
ncbi:MAG TPA: Ppx/GppA phosphatase family protein [Terriglobia bacterium]|nr:Ppx/GppA phosphatase family protein [Terriglobia bacterium]